MNHVTKSGSVIEEAPIFGTWIAFSSLSALNDVACGLQIDKLNQVDTHVYGNDQVVSSVKDVSTKSDLIYRDPFERIT